jgi:hypothetical protein
MGSSGSGKEEGGMYGVSGTAIGVSGAATGSWGTGGIASDVYAVWVWGTGS